MSKMHNHAYLNLMLPLLTAAILLAHLPLAIGGRAPVVSSLVKKTSFISTKRQLHSIQSHVTQIRGGGFDDFTDDEEYDDDFSDTDFDFDDEDGMFDFDAAEDDFGDDSTISSLIDAYHTTPPLTKAYLTASFGAALLGYVTSKNHDFPEIFQLEWKPVMTRGQIWRPLTAFLNFGPLGLGYLMTAHFVWTYMSTLERLNHSAPYDFWLMMFTGAASMVIGYSVMGLSPRFLGHNLSTFLVYVWSRYHEGLEVNMFELFNTRAEMLPWFFLAQTFLLEGEPPVLDFLGIVFGHIYHHYKTTNVLRTPRFVINWYNGDNKYAQMLREKYKTISSDFEM